MKLAALVPILKICISFVCFLQERCSKNKNKPDSSIVNIQNQYLLVSYSCYNKLPETLWLKIAKIYSLIVLKPRISKLTFQETIFQQEALGRMLSLFQQLVTDYALWTCGHIILIFASSHTIFSLLCPSFFCLSLTSHL